MTSQTQTAPLGAQPLPSRDMTKQTDVRFWDKIAEKYARSPIKNVAAYEATLDRVRHYLKPTDSVLEIGCGTGSTALRLAPNAGAYTATDISPEMIRIARGKSGAANLHFVEAPAVDDVFAPASFDAVFTSSLLHLVPDLDAALNRAGTVLKPGGLFISKTPCLGDMALPIRLLLPVLQWIGKAPHVLVFDKRELESRIARAGFEIVEARAFDGAPHSWFVVARKV